jgi:hypothetical protein
MKRLRHLSAFAVCGLLAAGTASAQQPGLLDNLSLFVGPDGSKQPQDLGINANMGIRLSANLGFPLLEDYGIGGQVGAACNLSDGAVHVLDQIEGSHNRQQTFVTIGAFSHSHPVTWALAYDILFERYYDNFTVSQLRGEAGYKLTSADEIGAWFTIGASGADAHMAGTPVRLDAISMVNGDWRRTWASGARTTLWAGVAGGHEELVWVIPGSTRLDHVFVYGADLQFPLNRRLDITGAANFITPTATGTVDAYLGVTFYPGRDGSASAHGRFAPPMTVANNPAFAVNLAR